LSEPTTAVLSLRAQDGRTAPAAAVIDEYPSGVRLATAVAFFAGGFMGAAACIIVPILHLVTTWALPLAGILMGLRTLRIEHRLGSITGTCPLCEQRITLRGGPVKASNWRVCPSCRKDVEVVIER